jgi:hypothetical protein
MKENIWKCEEALTYVKSKKPTIYPNYGFMNQLKLYEEKIFNK